MLIPGNWWIFCEDPEVTKDGGGGTFLLNTV